MGNIAVTGMGAATPFGKGVPCFWEALLKGGNAISQMDLFDLQGLACTQAGVCRWLDGEPSFQELPRALRLAALACGEALAQSGVPLEGTAVLTATNFGPDPLVPSPAKRDVDVLAERFGLSGVRIPVSLSCASGASALAFAERILLGIPEIERAVVVAYDAFSPFAWSGLCSLRTMTKEKIRPFDVRRSGTVFSEGAAAIVLERDAPGDRALAWLSGCATGNNGFHLTAPAARGAGSRCVMEQALRRSGFAPEAIGCIQAHGTGTKANDLTESQALHDLFGERAASIPLTAIKGAVGHLLGASSSAEVIAAVCSLRENRIPPTVNCETPDPECDVNVMTSPFSPAQPLQAVLCNAAGFGGCNAALVVSSERPAPEPVGASRVFIADAGAVTPLGLDLAETAAAFREGEPPEAYELPPFDLADYGVAPKAYVDAAGRAFLAAAAQAFEGGVPAGCGVATGTSRGCAETAARFWQDYEAKGPRFVRPFLFPHTYSNAPASLAAMEWALTGAHMNVAGGCAASALALLFACLVLRNDPEASILCGGTEATVAAAALLTGRETNARGEIHAFAVAPEVETVRARLHTAAGRPVLETLFGDTGGADAALQLALALSNPKPGETLVLSVSPGCCVGFLVGTKG
ncbi:MAG: beta-ketoacyl-[acyl-carrier-protein] synthase family protein [Kiritimatiellae bacterium]|nr:beta-ketoacyl-[acyl-carrier-protein] synthase family protein [Kiritimatiellia bacterium]